MKIQLLRPQTGYYEDLAQMIAAFFESLLAKHAFIDANKPIAFFASDVFLRLNGWKIDVDANSGFEFIIGSLETSKCDFEHLLPWLRKRLLEL